MEIELPESARLADLLAALCERHPALPPELEEAPPLIFIGDDEAGPDAPLQDGDRVHLVWSVAGG